MLSDYESEALKGRISKTLKGKPLESFMQAITELEDKHQDDVDWSIRNYAIGTAVNRGPGFILNAYSGSDGTSKLNAIIKIAESSAQPPRYVIEAYQLYIDLILSLDSAPPAKRGAIARFVNKYFDADRREDFFARHGSEIKQEDQLA